MASTPASPTGPLPPGTPARTQPPAEAVSQRSGSFRERLAEGDRRGATRNGREALSARRHKAQADPRGGHGFGESLQVRPDGLCVAGAPTVPPWAHGSTSTPAGTPLPARTTLPRRDGPTHPALLADVRTGTAAGQSRLHARIAVGDHAGVELRALERGGQVAVELWVPSAGDAAALRSELSSVREALASRGLEHVTVEVRCSDARHGAPGDPGARRDRRGDDDDDDDDAVQGSDAPGRVPGARRAASAGDGAATATDDVLL